MPPSETGFFGSGTSHSLSVTSKMRCALFMQFVHQSNVLTSELTGAYKIVR